MSLITINSRADLEQEFERGRRQGKKETLMALVNFIYKESERLKQAGSSLYSKGALDTYNSIFDEMEEIRKG